VLASALPWRRLTAIAGGGAVAGALVLLVGFAAERLVLGGDEQAFRDRVEDEVRSSFDGMSRALRQTALRLALTPAISAAAAGDAAAARQLFDEAESVVSAFAGELAVTVYTAVGSPLAWAGRPSDLPPERIAGGEAWFFAQGALGLRLVHVAPVHDGGGRRLGAIAAERALPQVTTSEVDAAFNYPTRFSRVTIVLNFAAAPTQPDAALFDVAAPDGATLLTAAVSTADLVRARLRWRRAVRSVALIVTALAVLLLAGPLIDWRNGTTRRRDFLAAVVTTAVIVVAGRLLLVLASPADWATGALFSASAYASPLFAPLLTSPFDFLITALACGAIVALGFVAVEGWRLDQRRRRTPVDSPARRTAYVVVHLGAGAMMAALFVAGQVPLVRDTVANATVDPLHFSLHPWNTSTVALQAGLIAWSTVTLGVAVLLLRAASVPWRVRRHDARVWLGTALLWALPLCVWLFVIRDRTAAETPLWIAAAVAVVLAAFAPRLKARYRHGSQAFRLIVLTGGLVAPALAFYPTLFQVARESKAELVESRYAPQAVNQRQTIQQILSDSLQQIDAFPLLNELVATSTESTDAEALTDRAFQVWRVTGLADYPVTSSVELFGADGRLVSRFAFNLPDDLSAVGRVVERSCNWDVFEEVSPFFAEERRVLHAGRAACVNGTNGSPRVVGSIVVHAMLDYANLPFIASQNPYLQMLRPAELQDENLSGRDIDYAVYGWSGRPVYTSGDTAWQLDDATFRQVAESRQPRWAQLPRGDELYDVYLTNDRFGIYALGFPTVTPLGHLVNLAELTVLAAGTYVLLLTLNMIFAWLSLRHTSAPALLREVRASFYRKLFLAFVLASVVPVVALAIVARNYVASEMDDAVEEEAVRTAAAARRVVEDLVAPRAAEQGAGIDDNLMVWVSRLIDQDVNIFRGSRLQATSERNLFASGLLPARTPAPVYRGLMLRNEAATVSRERVGAFEYLVAGTPVKARQIDAILTVPLTARQQEIEDQIDLLNRQVLLGALLCILAGAGIGYSLAERIADPVNRLTRATRRIARGELNVRVAATSSDELRRLVEDFNSMAGELQQQRRELERTHRLEAWAEMSRQVAHDIKNPLTPIQLNAEHLRRVHADRGQPLSPVLEECVGNILTQVRLLRQIASEFSSFAASPTVRPATVDAGDLLREIISPYQTALAERIHFDLRVGELPPVSVDRSLVTRALTNVIENALHAMPSTGTLTVVASALGEFVRIRVTDTGPGMDPEALARAFEPYFSTKATGTGLGLPIAKRNVELNGGEITIATGPGGTTVEMSLPTA
jgi:signal transduction histidine kinase